MPAPARHYFVYVGTFSVQGSEGIYACKLDGATGRLDLLSVALDQDNPSYVTIHPSGRYLYAANRVPFPDGTKHGFATAFSIDEATGSLTRLNRQPTESLGACYVSVDATGRYVLVAHFDGGSVAVLPIHARGAVEPVTDLQQHQGSSVRTHGPRAHCILPDPRNRFAFVPDLGLDRVMVYRLDLEQGKLVPHEVPWVSVRAGAGPRHMTFHPTGRWAYLINELDSTITVFAYDSERGVLAEEQTVSTLPAGYMGENACADIHVHPSGRFVYGSNRGHDSIVIYQVEEPSGRLAYVGHQSTQGKTPRNFALDPSGSLLVAANQDMHSLVTFRVDPETGRLTPTGYTLEIPCPVCIKMLPASRATTAI